MIHISAPPRCLMDSTPGPMSLVQLRIELPTYAHSFIIQVPISCNILDVKQEISRECPGGPRVEGQRLICRGRYLVDHEKVEDIWKVILHKYAADVQQLTASHTRPLTSHALFIWLSILRLGHRPHQRRLPKLHRSPEPPLISWRMSLSRLVLSIPSYLNNNHAQSILRHCQ